MTPGAFTRICSFDSDRAVRHGLRGPAKAGPRFLFGGTLARTVTTASAAKPHESPKRRSNGRPGRRHLFRALAVGLSLILAACFAEVVLRLADVQTTALLVRDAQT